MVIGRLDGILRRILEVNKSSNDLAQNIWLPEVLFVYWWGQVAVAASVNYLNPIKMLFRIIGVIDGSFQEEVIDQFATKGEAKANLAHYRTAFGSNWKLFIV